MFFLSTLRYFRMIVINNTIAKFLLELLFLLLHVSFFYFLLYKINNGVLSIYIGICFVFGCFFCHLLYYGDKKS